MIETVLHRLLKVPYTLHVRYNQRPNRPRATLLFIHGIGTSGKQWEKVIEKLPDDIRIITIDLLGFGDSPMPEWAVYDAKTQARSVLATFLKLRIRTPVIIIGHSLGALVSIEMAKRYPLLVRELILCSPPLYRNVKGRLPQSEAFLRRSFQTVQNHPDRFRKLAELGHRYKLLKEKVNLTDDNIASYMATLGSAIVNQTSLRDAANIKVPATIIYGRLDPFIIARNYSRLAKYNPNIKTKAIIAGHDIYGKYVPTIVTAIDERLQKTDNNAINKTR